MAYTRSTSVATSWGQLLRSKPSTKRLRTRRWMCICIRWDDRRGGAPKADLPVLRPEGLGKGASGRQLHLYRLRN